MNKIFLVSELGVYEGDCGAGLCFLHSKYYYFTRSK